MRHARRSHMHVFKRREEEKKVGRSVVVVVNVLEYKSIASDRGLLDAGTVAVRFLDSFWVIISECGARFIGPLDAAI